MGRELLAWYDAKVKVMDVDAQNSESVQLLTAGLGLAIAAGTNTKSGQWIGGLLVANAAASLSNAEFNKVRNLEAFSKIVPENHLLVDTIVIPPGLFTDRWVLLSSTEHDLMGYVDSFLIEYTLTDGTLHTHRIVLDKKERDLKNRKWQSHYYRKLNPETPVQAPISF